MKYWSWWFDDCWFPFYGVRL